MPSVIALRAILGASLGLGSLDLVWLNVALAPAVVGGAHERPILVERAAVAPAPPVVAVATEPTPGPPPPAVEPAVVEPAVVEPAVVEPAVTTVYFASMSAGLDHATSVALRRIAKRAGSTATFVVEGHADYRGTETFNRTLSKQRAIVIGKALERLGIARARIQIGFVGEAQAVTSGELWRDRRVDIQLVGGPQ